MSLFGPAMAGLFTTIAMMLALRPMAVRHGLVDSPGGRKAHVGDVPLVGGMAMFIGMIAGFTLIPAADQRFTYMFLAGAILLVVGVIDDRRHLSTYTRLGAQTVAACVMVFGGDLLIADLGNVFGTGTVHLGAGAVVFTVLVSITVINAFNFIDGIDGLAACLAGIAIAAVAFAGAALPTSITATGFVIFGCILGFLLFNFPTLLNRRVRTFMGDAGSTLLGIVVLWLTIEISQGEGRAISPIIGLWFVLIPLADIFTCFIRRVSKGKSPLQPGRQHLHHILLRGRLGVRQVLFVLTGLAALYAVIALFAHSLGVPDVVMFGGWVVLMFVQYPLIKKIALTTRSQCWKRVRANALSVANGTITAD